MAVRLSRYRGHGRRLAALGLGLVAGLYLMGCGLLYGYQRSIIYHPVGRAMGDGVPFYAMARDDARVLVSTDADAASATQASTPTPTSIPRAVVYFGGNAEDVSGAVGLLDRAFPGAAVYALHYRGYGGSTGEPTETALVADALALFDEVVRRHPRVVLVGRSLGSGVAVQVAAHRRAERLVLVTPYDSITALAAERVRWFPVRWLLADRFESATYAANLTTPTTIVIAERDTVIPPENSRRLAAAFPPGVARVVEIPGAGHNDVANFPAYLPALAGRSPEDG